MRVSKRPVEEIEISLNTFKSKVDEIASNFAMVGASETAKIKEHLDKGEWTKEYCQQKIDEAWHENLQRVQANYDKAHEKAKNDCDFYLSMINRKYNQYFNAGVRPEFVSKIEAYKSMGVTPVKRELELMCDEAYSYSEKQIVKAYIMDLGKPRVTKDDKGNIDHSQTYTPVDITDYERYGLDDVDIDATYKALDDFRDSIYLVLDHYCASDVYLYPITGHEAFVDKGNGVKAYSDDFNFYAVNATNFWDNKKDQEIRERIDKLNGLTERKTALTASERDLLNTLLSPFITDSSKRRAVNVIVDADPRLASLIEVSEYADFID